MGIPLFSLDRVRVRALYLGQRIDTRSLEANRLATQPLVVEAGAGGVAVIFRYGVVVLCGVSAVEEASFLRHLAALVSEPFETPRGDELTLVVDAEAAEGATTLPDGAAAVRAIDLARLQVVADVLAKNVVLDYFEETLREGFETVEPLAKELARGGKGKLRGRELAGHIGRALLVQTKTVGRVEVSEKPDVLWDAPALERLYQRLEDEYELTDRHAALERKLVLVAGTAQTLLDLRNHERSLRVEWYIVALIAAEIGLTLYELFLHPH
ncbi:MAG: RMD1 family protein [Myxococcales bacterium]|nr:RMD1 family protein [Myxococcales bacterium]